MTSRKKPHFLLLLTSLALPLPPFPLGPAAAAGALKTKIEVHATDQDALQKVVDVISHIALL